MTVRGVLLDFTGTMFWIEDAETAVAASLGPQFAAFARTGLPLDHVNAHKHFHMHRIMAAQVINIGHQFGMRALRVPREPGHVMAPGCTLLAAQARRAGLVVPDAVLGLRYTGRMTRERVLTALEKAPPGLVEVYTHPAISDRFEGCAKGYRYRDELAALTDVDVVRTLRATHRSIGGYADAQRLPLSAANIRLA